LPVSIVRTVFSVTGSTSEIVASPLLRTTSTRSSGAAAWADVAARAPAARPRERRRTRRSEAEKVIDEF